MKNQHLREVLDRLVEEAFLSSAFDMEEFKALADYKARMNYVQDRGLVRVGCGISRCAYVLTPTKVIKIGKGPEQNSKEFEAFQKFGPKYAPVIYDHDPNFWWLVSEHATTWNSPTEFEQATGLAEDWLTAALDFQMVNKIPPNRLLGIFSAKKPWHVPDVNPTPLGKELVKKMAHLSAGGLHDTDRWDHWGITGNGRLVCVDLGINDW